MLQFLTSASFTYCTVLLAQLPLKRYHISLPFKTLQCLTASSYTFFKYCNVLYSFIPSKWYLTWLYFFNFSSSRRYNVLRCSHVLLEHLRLLQPIPLSYIFLKLSLDTIQPYLLQFLHLQDVTLSSRRSYACARCHVTLWLILPLPVIVHFRSPRDQSHMRTR